jgi:hypothetical protein
LGITVLSAGLAKNNVKITNVQNGCSNLINIKIKITKDNILGKLVLEATKMNKLIK